MTNLDRMVCIELLNTNNGKASIGLWGELSLKWGDKANIPAFDVGIEDCGPVIEYNSSEIDIDKLVKDIQRVLPKYGDELMIGLIYH